MAGITSANPAASALRQKDEWSQQSVWEQFQPGNMRMVPIGDCSGKRRDTTAPQTDSVVSAERAISAEETSSERRSAMYVPFRIVEIGLETWLKSVAMLRS